MKQKMQHDKDKRESWITKRINKGIVTQSSH